MPLSGLRLTSLRRAGRAALLDESDAVLLQSGIEPGSPDEPGFWFLPGGGAMVGESLEDAAPSRIYEETGARLGDLGPWCGNGTFASPSMGVSSNSTSRFLW